MVEKEVTVRISAKLQRRAFIWWQRSDYFLQELPGTHRVSLHLPAGRSSNISDSSFPISGFLVKGIWSEIWGTHVYLDPSDISSSGQRPLAGDRPATEIYRHKTHLFEATEQDSESRYGLREGVGQKEKGMLIQGQLRPYLPWGPKAWSALEAGVDKLQAHSHLRKKPRNKSKAIRCKSINCSIWGATPMIWRMCQCCVFVNSITGNDTCYMPGSAQGVSIWGYPQELTTLYKDKGIKQSSWHSMMHRGQRVSVPEKEGKAGQRSLVGGGSCLPNYSLTEKSKHTWRIYFCF